MQGKINDKQTAVKLFILQSFSLCGKLFMLRKALLFWRMEMMHFSKSITYCQAVNKYFSSLTEKPSSPTFVLLVLVIIRIRMNCLYTRAHI